MAVKRAFAAAACAAFVALGAPARADEYRAGELLGLDLSSALLSPKRLGPPTKFAPVPVEARTDSKQVIAEPKVDQRRVVHTTRVTARAEKPQKPRTPARTKLTRRHSNPLDANAMARPVRTTRIEPTRIQPTRIQTWPCTSGGICNWSPQAVYRID